MPKDDIFAIRDFRYNAFLFADVGTEFNASPLTILSLLARLGEDPWAQAACWATESRTVAIEALAASLNGRPSIALSMDIARPAASRLILLLPGKSCASATVGRSRLLPSDMQHWQWVILGVLCVYMILTSFVSPRPSPIAGTPSRTSTAASP